jgi:hypothetical protein
MAQTSSIARAVRDVGLANRFGGLLMGAIGLNGSVGVVSDLRERTWVPRAGWQRWTPWPHAADRGEQARSVGSSLGSWQPGGGAG